MEFTHPEYRNGPGKVVKLQKPISNTADIHGMLILTLLAREIDGRRVARHTVGTPAHPQNTVSPERIVINSGSTEELLEVAFHWPYLL